MRLWPICREEELYSGVGENEGTKSSSPEPGRGDEAKAWWKDCFGEEKLNGSSQIWRGFLKGRKIIAGIELLRFWGKNGRSLVALIFSGLGTRLKELGKVWSTSCGDCGALSMGEEWEPCWAGENIQLGLGTLSSHVQQPRIRSGETAPEPHQTGLWKIQGWWKRKQGRKLSVPVRASPLLWIQETDDEQKDKQRFQWREAPT